MKCPICCLLVNDNTNKCPNCGFDQLKSEFLTKEDYQHWLDDTVTPCQTIYNTQLKTIALLTQKIHSLEKENENLKKTQIVSGKNLAEFFKKNGFEVIDKRPAGGCLWVIGEKAKLEPYVETARTLFKIGDNGFSAGKSTSNRSGWYTNSKE